MKPVSAPAAIIAVLRSLHRGEVVSYSEVARRAGLPGRARLVARVLVQASDEGLPWHRVLRADGRIAFPVDSDSWHEQARRLRAEGVVVDGGRVKLQRRSSEPDDLDAVLWRPGP